MRLPGNRRTLYVAACLVVLAIAMTTAFGPLVRGRVAREALRRHLVVDVGGVRPGWFSVRLLDVHVHPADVAQVSAHLDEVRVRLSVGLSVEGVEVKGGEIRLVGDADDLRERLRAWRESSDPSAPAAAAHHFPIAADSVAVRWLEAEGQLPRAEMTGASMTRDDSGLTAAFASSVLRFHDVELEVQGGALAFDGSANFVRAHAASVAVQWLPGLSPLPVEEPPAAPPAASSAPPGPVLPARATLSALAHARPLTATAVDPSKPLLPFPELHALRGVAFELASRIAQKLPVGAEARVDAVTWKLGPSGEDGRGALTIGPGPLALTRSPTHVEVTFSSDRRDASPALSIRLALPTADGDTSATLEGGPVSLSVLGIHDGAAGLVDVSRATVTGTAHLTLAGDGSGLSFDAELGTRALSLHQPRLALDVVRDIDLGVRVRGAATDVGELRLDDFAANLGALHLAGSGSLDQQPDHVAASFRFELPSTPCQSLLDSVPTALLPALQGTRMSGTFGARGRFAFDTRALEDLQLEYDVQDECKVAEVPAPLARERFKQPFAHRIYLPDGSTGEQTTGPGTSNWTPLGRISPFMEVAVMTTEDGAFLHHRGFNRSAIRASIVTNLKARRFVRGASTITMQLAKNLFLSRDKTLARKLEEVVLTDYLEQAFSKDELMELYLNVIEFGPAVYGITAAAEYYFGRSPDQLDLAECLFLSSLLPSPIRYGAMRDLPQVPDGWMHTIRNLMSIANKRGLVSDVALAEGMQEPITFWHGGERPPARPPVSLRSRLEGNDEDDGSTPSLDPPGDTP